MICFAHQYRSSIPGLRGQRYSDIQTPTPLTSYMHKLTIYRAFYRANLQLVEVALDRAALEYAPSTWKLIRAPGESSQEKARGHGRFLEGAHSVVVEFHPVVSDHIPDTVRLDLDMVPLVGRPVLWVAGDV